MRQTHVMALREAFVAEQFAALEPFDFVVVAVPAPPFDGVRVARGAEGTWEVEVGTRAGDPPFSEEQVADLVRLGFGAEPPWTARIAPDDATAAAALVERALCDVLGLGSEDRVDLHHGNRRAEHEAEQKLDHLRARVEPILTTWLGRAPERDADGDYVFDFESAQVYVAPRAAPNSPIILRVFAITNVGLNVTPDLGLFLSRLNFSLTFGRFALDADNRAVWFDEVLLAEDVSDEELQFAVRVVAQTANEWDDRIAQMFGGVVRRRASATADGPPSAKPGEGGYL
jgi:type III secretion system-like peptide-binding chaperone